MALTRQWGVVVGAQGRCFSPPLSPSRTTRTFASVGCSGKVGLQYHNQPPGETSRRLDRLVCWLRLPHEHKFDRRAEGKKKRRRSRRGGWRRRKKRRRTLSILLLAPMTPPRRLGCRRLSFSAMIPPALHPSRHPHGHMANSQLPTLPFCPHHSCYTETAAPHWPPEVLQLHWPYSCCCCFAFCCITAGGSTATPPPPVLVHYVGDFHGGGATGVT